MRSLLHSILVPFIAIGGAATASAQTTLTYADGSGEVTVPANYEKYNDPDVGLALASQPDRHIRLFFDLHKLDEANRIQAPGEDFVRQQAKQNGKQTKEVKGRVVLMEPGRLTEVDGEEVVNMHLQIGFQKTVVVMSIAIPKRLRDAEDVKKFFASDLEFIVANLRRVGG